MSNERETLIKDLSIGAVDGFFYITRQLQAEIRELLTQKRESLSSEDIGTGFLATDVWHRYECFIAGVQFAEKMHGIGVDDE